MIKMASWNYKCRCKDQATEEQRETWYLYEEAEGKMFYYWKGKKRAMYPHNCNRAMLIQIRRLALLSNSSMILYAMKDAIYQVYGHRVYEEAQLFEFYWDEDNGRVQNMAGCRNHINIDVIGKKDLHFELIERELPKLYAKAA